MKTNWRITRTYATLLAFLVMTAGSLASASSASAVGSAVPANITCVVTANNAHYSKGAKSVIGKVRYSCTGNATGTLSLRGWLYQRKGTAAGPYKPLKVTTYGARTVRNGSQGTFYIPKSGVAGLTCRKGFQYATEAYATMTAPPGTKTIYVRSGFAAAKCP